MQNELRTEHACLHLQYIALGQAGAREVAKWPRSVRLDERQIPRHSEDTCPSILLRGELVYAFFSKEDTVVGRLRGIGGGRRRGHCPHRAATPGAPAPAQPCPHTTPPPSPPHPPPRH